MSKEKILVVKIGGNIIDDENALRQFLKSFAKIDGKKILIHGGGKLATKLADQLGIQQQMVNGRRITDIETLKIVTMTYAGWINKSIVAALHAEQCDSIGVCGVDGALIPAVKRVVHDIDYGFVGDINFENIQADKLLQLLEIFGTVVIAPITSNHEGQLLNTNADTIATHIACAMQNYYDVSLYFCFEKKGILSNPNDDSSVISSLDKNYFDDIKKSGNAKDGILPKLENAFLAVEKNVSSVKIIHAEDLMEDISNNNKGTLIHA